MLNSSKTNKRAAINRCCLRINASPSLNARPKKPGITPKARCTVTAPYFIWKDAHPVGAAKTHFNSANAARSTPSLVRCDEELLEGAAKRVLFTWTRSSDPGVQDLWDVPDPRGLLRQNERGPTPRRYFKCPGIH